MSRISDQELEALIASLTIQGSKVRLELAQDLREARLQLATLRENRWHASSLLECREKLTDTSCDLHDAQVKLKKYEEALKQIDKHWFDPSDPERGCCAMCDGGIHPDWLDRHEPKCVLQIAHEALK